MMMLLLQQYSKFFVVSSLIINVAFPPVILVQAATFPIMAVTAMIRIADMKFIFSVFMGDLPSLAREYFVHDLSHESYLSLQEFNTPRTLAVPIF